MAVNLVRKALAQIRIPRNQSEGMATSSVEVDAGDLSPPPVPPDRGGRR